MAAPFHLTRTELQVIILSLVLIACARLPALMYVHSADDYSYNISQEPIAHYFNQLLGEGRFGCATLLTILHALGLRQAGSPAVSGLLAAICAAFGGILICRLWNTLGSRILSVIITCLVALVKLLSTRLEGRRNVIPPPSFFYEPGRAIRQFLHLTTRPRRPTLGSETILRAY